MTLQRMLKRVQKELSQYKILILGPDNAGKTTIIHHITNNNTKVKPTFGYRIHTLNHKNKALIIHDIGGQLEIQKYWYNFYEKIEGVVFVFDVCDSRDFELLLNNVVSMVKNSNVCEVPILIMANKCDVSACKVSVKCEGKMKMMKTSAITGENILEGFDWLVEEIMKNEFRI